MLELGPHSLQYHEDILDACLDHGFDLVSRTPKSNPRP